MKKLSLILSGLLMAGAIYADQTVETVEELRNQSDALLLLQNEEFHKAEKTLFKALNIELKKYGAQSTQTAQSQLVHAEILFYLGKYDFAINTAKSSLNILGRAHGADSLEAARAGYVLGKLFFKTGQIVLAEATIRKTLEIQLKKPVSPPEIAASRIILAGILSLKDKNKAALAELQMARKGLRRNAPACAEFMIALSTVYTKMEEMAKAREVALQAVDFCNKRWGSDSLHSALASECLAGVYAAEEKFVEARKLLPGIAGIMLKKVGPKHLLIVELMALRGYIYMREGNLPTAQQLLNKATADMQRILPEKNIKTAFCMFYSGRLDVAMKSFAAARILLEHAVSVFINQLGSNNLTVASCLNELSIIASQDNQPQKAVRYAEQVTRLYTDLRGGEHLLTAAAWRNLAYMYTRDAKPQKAVDAYAVALKIFAKHPDQKNDITIARICADMAALYGSLKQPAKAKEYCMKALVLCDKNPKVKDENIAMIYYRCSFYYYSVKDFRKAYELVDKAKSILTEAYGPKYPAIRSCDGTLQMIKKQM